MADVEDAVPQGVQRRLMTVLSHLAEQRPAHGSCEHAALHPQSCRGGDNGKTAAVDIEELAGISGRLHSADHLDENEAKLFDPTRFEETRRPLLEASTLPSEVYNSQAWYRRELDQAFMPSWFIVGREDEIREPGQYLAVDTEWGGPVAVVRGNDNSLYAFANVCAHRGAKILPDGCGKAPRSGLICPYHAWTYDYTGQLLVAPGMHQAKHFDEGQVKLRKVRLDTFHGFIFVNHSAKAKALSETLGDMPEKLPEWFGPNGVVKDMVCVARRSYDVPCNWKFIYENTCETYHTSIVHKGSLGPMKSSPMEPHVGDWDGVRVPSKRSIVPLPTDFEGVDFPLPAFTDKSCFINVFPSLQINVTWDCIWWMNTIPTGQSSTRIEMGFCFPAATQKLSNFPTVLDRYLHRWNVAVLEDNTISLNQQRSVRSMFRTPGRFCQLEFGTHNFNNWLLSKVVNDDRFSWDPGKRVFTDNALLWSNDDQQMLRLAEEVTHQEHESPSMGMKVPRPLKANGVASHDCTLGGGTTVCVTGANGFIGLHLVKLLLKKGCHVIAAVRNADERRVSPLLAMHTEHPQSLRIVGGCEVLSQGSFDAVVRGCQVCFHLASPFWMDERISDPFKELVEPAEAGTLNVLQACAKAGTVRRVVITSSFAAIMNVGGNKPWPTDFHYSEAHWNQTSAPVDGVFPEPQNVHAYRWSKTVAERAAWDFVEKEKPSFDVTCICPPMVLGPNLQRLTCVQDLNQSSLIVFKMLSGQMEHVMPGSVGFADVRDVALAHVLAAERGAAGSQRYLCSGATHTWLQVASLLQEIFPGCPLPSTCADGSREQPCLTLDAGKIRRDLGLDFMPLRETLRAQGQAFFDAGLLP
eukprot:TRINITY_DN26612_c0_g1_i1.p1 TRINITY_DN26612_c0_g1~~TRINITY_DN26612_c0_g1_i1.p1  ORF type:complete len:863 (+),score=160.36 TRINITY_DN26612_c0_g1_i1:78-2666(+)